jgi:hypothetical protein
MKKMMIMKTSVKLASLPPDIQIRGLQNRKEQQHQLQLGICNKKLITLATNISLKL